MTFRGVSPTSVWRVAACVCAAALLCLVLASPAQAVTYYNRYFETSVVNQTLSVVRNESMIPTVAATANWSVTIYYGYEHDDAAWANWSTTSTAAKYSGSVVLSNLWYVRSVAVPVDPRWRVYYIVCSVTGTDANLYRSYSVIANDKAQIVIANDEPTPVRIQEIGLASQAATLAPNVLPVSALATITSMPPVSLDTSVSVDGTLPVSVVSLLGESDGPIVWGVLGGISAIVAFAGFTRMVSAKAVDHV